METLIVLELICRECGGTFHDTSEDVVVCPWCIEASIEIFGYIIY